MRSPRRPLLWLPAAALLALAAGAASRSAAARAATPTHRAPAITSPQWGAVQAAVTLLRSHAAEGYLFADGFESGATSHWSATAP